MTDTRELGPGSFLSICSKSGIEWVADKTGVADFANMARQLSVDVSSQLKLDTALSTKRIEDPDEATAWQWTRLYFEQDSDSAFGIVPRSNFESLLRAHYRRDFQQEALNDAGWYALRNVVFAAGSRMRLVRTTGASSREAFLASRSWQYFLNAMSVHMELLYCRTSLMAVQAMAAMVRDIVPLGLIFS
jgi:hypothetical protein